MLPEDAFYLTVVPPKNDGQTVHRLTIKGEVPVDGFWSISVYGADGYFHVNEQNTYNINGTTAKKDADGSITIQFGGCDGIDAELHSDHTGMELLGPLLSSAKRNP
jgi:hypothetical protein